MKNFCEQPASVQPPQQLWWSTVLWWSEASLSAVHECWAASELCHPAPFPFHSLFCLLISFAFLSTVAWISESRSISLAAVGFLYSCMQGKSDVAWMFWKYIFSNDMEVYVSINPKYCCNKTKRSIWPWADSSVGEWVIPKKHKEPLKSTGVLLWHVLWHPPVPDSLPTLPAHLPPHPTPSPRLAA